ncbi:hypothetical protein A9Q99_07885 [Gammaproteobacteria bacterium 45_16_T64]|nr:hypothetical protein A9Q99_07885 [Gammaproteobacteria bacterium 45_16_T64]
MIQAAAELFERRGYYGTGMNEILSRASAPKGSAYFHFPGGKDDVAIHAIQFAGKQIGDLLKAGLAVEQNPHKIMGVLVGFFKMRLVQEDFRCGCPVGTVGLELSGTDSPVLDACKSTYLQWSQILADYLSVHIDEAKAGEVADAAFSMIQGGLMVSRINSDLSHLDIVEKYCTALVVDTISGT